MSKKSTPGPWRVEIMEGGSNIVKPTYVIASDRTGDDGAIAYCEHGPDDNEEENARLIAAVPELLEACEKAAELLAQAAARTGRDDYREEYRAISEQCFAAAIKTEGKEEG